MRPDIRQYLTNCHQLGSESALAHLGASTYDPTASDSAGSPPKRQNGRECGFPGFGGARGLDACHQSAKDPSTGGSSSPRRSGRSSRRAVEDSRRPKRGYARPSPPRRVSRGGAPPRPPLPWRAGNAGVRGGRAPRQPPQGTHGVWPQGVRWLNDETGARQHPRAAPTNAPIRPTASAPFDGFTRMAHTSDDPSVPFADIGTERQRR